MLPITRPAPSSFAIRPTAVPTPPAAAETNTLSPGCSFAIRVSPTYALSPVPPRIPRYADSGTPSRSTIGRISSGVTTAWVRQLCRWNTRSPTASAGVRDSVTRPIARPSSGVCRSHSLSMHSRMYGSTDSSRFSTSAVPGLMSGSVSTNANRSAVGNPVGRAIRWISVMASIEDRRRLTPPES